TNFSFTKGILAFILFTVFYIAIVYYLLVSNVELTESGRLLRFLSGNDYLLTVFFVSVFYVCYILTCYYITYAYAVFLILMLKIKHR
ncbi:TPA: colicin immunity protein Cui, partial [Enterobacter bugandensis]|nr:colicin immunity protein Cui [Enterobacter bugandensis]